jgi:hypothetical protein
MGEYPVARKVDCASSLATPPKAVVELYSIGAERMTTGVPALAKKNAPTELYEETYPAEPPQHTTQVYGM